MKEIWRNIIIVCIVLFSILFCLEKLWDFGIGENVNHKTSFIQKHSMNAELIIAGPCEPLWMISPKQLEKHTTLRTYNLASSHSDFAENYLSLYLYLKNNAAPKYLLLYVTPESIDSNYNTFNTYRFTAELNDSTVNQVIKENDKSYSNYAMIPFMHHGYYSRQVNFLAIQGLKHWYTNRALPFHEDGFEPPHEIVWDNHLDWFKQYFPKGYQFKINANRLRYLNQIISLCQSHKIKLIFYESPVLKESLEIQANRTEMMKTIQNIADKNKIPYLIFDGMKVAEEKSNFISVLVLNKKNSELFCDTLGVRLSELILNNSNIE